MTPSPVSTRLDNLLVSQRLVTSYIFSGSDETQKWSAAKYLAQQLNCETKADRPCGVCSSCQLIEQEKFHGLIRTSNEEPSIKIDEIRDLLRKVALGGDRYWIVVYVREANRLTTTAANSLLKTLEDTPEKVMFIFDVKNPYLLLPTIRSRSQVLSFGLQPLPIKSDALVANIAIDKLLETIQNSSKEDLVQFCEDTKLDRLAVQAELSVWIDWLLRRYEFFPDSRLLQVVTDVRKTIAYMERPVNVSTNWLLLTWKIKEIYAS